MVLKKRRTQKIKTNGRRRKKTNGRGKRLRKNTRKNLRNKRQSRKRGGGEELNYIPRKCWVCGNWTAKWRHMSLSPQSWGARKFGVGRTYTDEQYQTKWDAAKKKSISLDNGRIWKEVVDNDQLAKLDEKGVSYKIGDCAYICDGCSN